MMQGKESTTQIDKPKKEKPVIDNGTLREKNLEKIKLSFKNAFKRFTEEKWVELEK